MLLLSEPAGVHPTQSEEASKMRASWARGERKSLEGNDTECTEAPPNTVLCSLHSSMQQSFKNLLDLSLLYITYTDLHRGLERHLILKVTITYCLFHFP